MTFQGVSWSKKLKVMEMYHRSVNAIEMNMSNKNSLSNKVAKKINLKSEKT